MKRYGILAVLLLAMAIALAPPVGTGQFSKINASTTVPVALTNVTLLVKEVTFLGKSTPRTDNTGDVYIGEKSGDDVNAFKLSPGGEAVIRVQAQDGLINLANWFVDVTTANDGVTVIYR